jgi:cytochrome b-561
MPVKSSTSFRMTALPMVVTAQLLAAAVLALTLVWVLHFRGGVSLNRRSNLFVYTVISHALHRIFLNRWSNIRYDVTTCAPFCHCQAHPLFMVIGFIICTGEGKRTYARLYCLQN